MGRYTWGASRSVLARFNESDPIVRESRPFDTSSRLALLVDYPAREIHSLLHMMALIFKE
jgi:hypothetical protein